MYHYYPIDRQVRKQKSNRLKVSGEGEVAVPPDLVSVHLGVITESKELISAQQQNAAIAEKVINTLVSLGVDKQQIQTFDYRIDSEYDFDQGKQTFRGYKISHIFQVKLKDLSLIGKVVDSAVQNGVNYVSNIVFTSSKNELYYQQALAAAIQNAIVKANTITNTLKVTLIPTPIHLEENSVSPIRPFDSVQVSYAKGITPTQIEPGQLVIKASITAEFTYDHN
ncbi:MAG: SIMPL domain-containing protein [Neobacillus sp.]